MIPGMDILAQALSLIGSEPVTFYKAIDRARNAAGYIEPTFADGVCIEIGSVQAVARSKFQVLGLDWSKKYVTWFVEQNAIGLERGTSGDQFDYAGEKFQIESVTDWYAQDGWLAALAVKIGAANA